MDDYYQDDTSSHRTASEDSQDIYYNGSIVTIGEEDDSAKDPSSEIEYFRITNTDSKTTYTDLLLSRKNTTIHRCSGFE